MPLLLDTCALIWLVNGQLDASPARPAMLDALRANQLLVSVTSAWEIGLLGRSRLDFRPDPRTWFGRATQRPGFQLVPITPEIAIDSSFLPGAPHGDPADRLILATARHLGATVVTRDQRMLAYAEAGHAEALRC